MYREEKVRRKNSIKCFMINLCITVYAHFSHSLNEMLSKCFQYIDFIFYDYL